VGYRRDDGVLGAGERVRTIRRTLWGVLGLNLGVAAAKIAWGVASGSTAMQADGFHSLFDGTSNVVGLIGMGMASRPADRDHPYGHSKYETYASAVIGAMLLFAAYRIGGEAIANLREPAGGPEVGIVSFLVMFGTLAVNLTVTAWERRVGKRVGSEILVADSNHTLSDAFVSIGVIVGLVLVRLGYPRADAIVALLVSGAILYTALGVFRQASRTLSDEARMDPKVVCETACSVDGVLGCHHVRTRGLESEVYVDLHIQVDPQTTVAEGHELAETVERTIAEQYPHVIDVIAHLEPFDDYQRAKTAEEIDAGLV